MIFKTKRCEIRLFEEKDLDDFMLYRNNFEWMLHQSFKNQTKESYREVLIKPLDYLKGMQLAIVNNQLIGDLFVLEEDNCFWVGYTISPVYARQGYATEVLESLIQWGKVRGNYKIKAGVLRDNIPSIKLLEKLSFELIKVEDDELIYEYHP